MPIPGQLSQELPVPQPSCLKALRCLRVDCLPGPAAVIVMARRWYCRWDLPLGFGAGLGVKLLLVSDLHYALKQFDWALAVARNFDLVVIAGDHLDVAGQLAGSVQIAVILKYLKRLSSVTKVIVSSGNHDLDVRDADGEKTASWMRRVRAFGIPTDGDTIEHDGALISICPWWDGPITKSVVEAQLARDRARRAQMAKGSKWLWVYHAPPAGSPTSWNGKRFYGDADLSGWIETHQPDFVLTGHIHEAPFKKDGSWIDKIGAAWVFNSGRQIGPTPTHIVLNTDVAQAAWFSMAGVELAHLDAPLERPLASLDAAPAWLT